jgi:hypothetical protein
LVIDPQNILIYCGQGPPVLAEIGDALFRHRWRIPNSNLMVQLLRPSVLGAVILVSSLPGCNPVEANGHNDGQFTENHPSEQTG